MLIYTMPIIAAVIGWFTNYLAVKMLFHPREKVRILFWDVQGIFPKKHHVLAQRIGKLVAEDLFSVQDIQEILTQPENVSKINQSIEEKIENYLTETFPEKYPTLAFFVSDKLKGKVRDTMMTELETMGPDVMNETIENLESSLDIESFIRERVSKFSLERMETLIQGILASEFKFIEFVGAVLGFVIGSIQLLLVLIGT
ncbi:MAG TPA: DUF445 family protein [Flavobacteriales bacterium]|nr:DUF445 family protein [Flavobacteriales bacterium]